MGEVEIAEIEEEDEQGVGGKIYCGEPFKAIPEKMGGSGLCRIMYFLWPTRFPFAIFRESTLPRNFIRVSICGRDAPFDRILFPFSR